MHATKHMGRCVMPPARQHVLLFEEAQWLPRIKPGAARAKACSGAAVA
jgi:hypothetical protein